MPTRAKPYFTFEECRAYAQKSAICSFQGWVAFKERDRRAPSNPQRTYKASWQGWTDFLGGVRRQRQPRSVWLPFAEARTYARGLACKSVKEWMDLSRGGRLPAGVPTSPRQVYGDEFTDWADFLGYDWMRYEEFCVYVRETLKITSHTVWKRLGRDALDPRAPSHPDRVYKSAGWQGWPSLFGTTRHSTASVQRGRSLADRFPEIAAEWHPTKNGDLTPDQIAGQSSTTAWWRCSKAPDHEWSVSAKARTNGAGSCPRCRSRKAVANSLAAKFPHIAVELHPDNELTADKIRAGSKAKVLWRCPKVPSHEWKMAPGNRTGNGQGCPHCAGRQASPTKNLAALYPEIAAEWHPTKNKKNPSDVLPGSHLDAWWRCPEGHESRGSVRLRVKGVTCPQCEGRQASPTNNLAVLRPDLACEWHPTKNEDLKPEHLTVGSSQKVWWRCQAGHEWQAIVCNRAKWSGCADCEHPWTLNNIRTFVGSLRPHLPSLTPGELWVIFQQSGALEMDGTRRRAFFKALSTGRFPQEEIERFVAGEPSTVDDFLKEAPSEGDGTPEVADKIVIGDTVERSERDDRTDVLPTVSVRGMLSAVNAAAMHASDPEAVEFLIASGKRKLERRLALDEAATVAEARAFVGDGYADIVRKQFLQEYEEARALPIPRGYAFVPPGRTTVEPPNLMQRLTARRVQRDRRVLNASGTGTGKTNSAILASRIIGAKLTLVCCPNSVVEGWVKAIEAMFPDSSVARKTFEPDFGGASKHMFVVINYQMFQQPDSAERVREFIEHHRLTFVVIDEIQDVKQRTEDVSQRRTIVGTLLALAKERNPELHVLGMSATPVINNLREGVALIEMTEGREHQDLETTPTVANCMRVYQCLTTLGPRWMPQHTTGYEQREIDVDCSVLVDEIRALGRRGTPLQLEEILTKSRLPAILDNIVPKTLIYTHYIGGAERLDRQLYDAISGRGWRVGFFTGEEKSGLDGFVDGDIDVLIASSAIATGVDGLQHVCNRLIINVLPWTAAELEQLIGRIHRQGQTRPVTVMIPLTRAEVNGEEWSWCKSKMQRLKFKKSIADAAVDGIVPEGHLISQERAYQNQMAWLTRLSEGHLVEHERAPATFDLVAPATTPDTRTARFGDFSRMNARWNSAASTTTQERLQREPAEWEHYHDELKRIRTTWPADPQEDFIRWATRRTDLVIGDFGCGRGRVREELADRHEVHGFDHVAANSDVVAGDMAHVPLSDEVLDVALFCLSFMGSNVTDYVREACRTLRLDGWLHIYEPTSRVSDEAAFIQALRDLGFGNVEASKVGAFTHVSARKTEHQPRAGATVRGLGA